MRRLTLFFIALLFTLQGIFAQSPNGFSYQAIVRDGSGNPQPNTSVTFQFSILQGSSSGTNVYTETQAVSSNDYGLVNMNIGEGTMVSGDISTIDWANGPYYLDVQLDDGSGYVDMGTQELLSVPYALYGEDADADPTNELQDISLSGNYLSLSGGSTVDLSVIQDGYEANTDNQTLSLSGSQLSISNGNSVTLNVDDADADATNELQTLSQSGTSVTLSNGGGTVSVADNDNDATNELQDISVAGHILSITNGSSVTLPDDNTTYSGANGIQIDGSNNVSLEPGIVFYVNPYNIVSANTNVAMLPNINGYVEAEASATGSSMDIIVPIDVPFELSGRNIQTISIDYKCDNANSFITATYIYCNTGLGVTSSLYTSTLDRTSTIWQSFGATINAIPAGNLYVILRLNYAGTGTPNDIAIGRIRVTMQ